jgi:DNA ligase (NAD+)
MTIPKSVMNSMTPLMQELITLETEYPAYAYPDSPTKRVGGVVLDSFEKVHHETNS